MSAELRAYIRELDRRVAHIERAGLWPTPRNGRPMTRPPRILDVKLTEDIASEDSGTCAVLDYNADAGEEVATSTEITVYNPSSEDLTAGFRAVVIERCHQAPPRRWHILSSAPASSIRFQNVSGETMPLGGVGIITDCVDDVLLVTKPTTANAASLAGVRFVINTTGEEVLDDEFGTCVHLNDVSPKHPVRVLYDPGSITPTAPVACEVWGPRLASTWKIYRGAPGLIILGDVDTSGALASCASQEQDPTLAMMSYSKQSSDPTTLDEFSVLFTDSGTVSGGIHPRAQVLVAHAAEQAGLNTLNEITRALPVFAIDDIDAAGTGKRGFQGAFAHAKPAAAIVAGAGEVGGTSYGAKTGELVGPIPGEQRLFRGLPGYRVVTQVGADTDVCLVIHSNLLPWCVAYAVWSGNDDEATMTCRALATPTGPTYDGSETWLPLVEFDVTMPLFGYGDPILQVDDVFQYRVDYTNTVAKFYPACDYLGAKVGTIQMWSGSPTLLPRGWAICDGTDNAAGSGLDLRGRFIVAYDGGSGAGHSDAAYSTVGATGGAKTHTHSTTSGSVFDADGPDITLVAADHRPPWFVLAFIERIP